MNYIKELNAFRDWLFFHRLPANAIALWHALIMINNKLGWKKTFKVPCSTIETLSGLNKQRLYEARKALAETGLISYEAGSIGEAAVYQIVPFMNDKDTNESVESEEEDHQPNNTKENADQISTDELVAFQKPDKSRDQTSDQSRYHDRDKVRPIIKQKQKQKRRRGSASEDNPFVVYEQNFGILKPINRDSLIAWCNDLGDDVVIHAIEKATKYGGRTFAYLEGILREYAQAKISSIEEVKAYEKQKSVQQTSRSNNFSKKSLFDELREEAQSL